MCQQCCDAVKKWFPNIPEDSYGDLLMSGTAFPMGSPEQINEQLEELAKNSDGTLDSALGYAHEQFRKDADRLYEQRQQSDGTAPEASTLATKA